MVWFPLCLRHGPTTMYFHGTLHASIRIPNRNKTENCWRLSRQRHQNILIRPSIMWYTIRFPPTKMLRIFFHVRFHFFLRVHISTLSCTFTLLRSRATIHYKLWSATSVCIVGVAPVRLYFVTRDSFQLFFDIHRRTNVCGIWNKIIHVSDTHQPTANEFW